MFDVNAPIGQPFRRTVANCQCLRWHSSRALESHQGVFLSADVLNPSLLACFYNYEDGDKLMRNAFNKTARARRYQLYSRGLLAMATFAAWSAPTMAGELTGSAAVLSHYKWAGADQNFYEDKSVFPTAQMSLYYTFDNGIYIGNWASTIKFLEHNRIDSTAYLGYFTKLGPGALDLSVGYNFYPGASYANTTSLYAMYSVSYFTLKWTGVVSDKYVGLPEGRGRQAVAIAAKYDLSNSLAIKGEVGRLFLTDGLRRQGLQQKAWFLAGADYKINKDLTFGAAVTGASPINAERIGWRDKTRLVLSLTHNF